MFTPQTGKAALCLGKVVLLGVCENATLCKCVCVCVCVCVWNQQCNRLFVSVAFVMWAHVSCFQDVETCVKMWSASWRRAPCPLCCRPPVPPLPRSTSPPYPPSPSLPGQSFSSYRLPPVVMSPVVSPSAPRALPRSPKEKERKENSDNHFRATKEVGDTCLGFLPHISSRHLHARLCPFNTEPLGLMCLPSCTSGCLHFVLFSGQSFSLSRWWGGWAGEKIGNRATHSGSESAQHLVVCWLWKCQGFGGVGGGGDRWSCQNERGGTVSDNLLVLSTEGSMRGNPAKWQQRRRDWRRGKDEER